jgi:hypothetical protein
MKGADNPENSWIGNATLREVRVRHYTKWLNHLVYLVFEHE